MRPTHLDTRYKHDLSPRQQEVLELIAAGKTNPEIAESLGISLDGAKYHVREILAKLEVDSREEAAQEWRRMRSPVARLRHFVLPALHWLPNTGVVLAFIGLAVAGAAVVGVIALLSGDTGETGLAPGQSGPGATATSVQPPTAVPSPTRDGVIPDLSQFDPEPIPLDPSTEPCEPSRHYVLLSVGGGDLIGACATWQDTWDDELGFVMRVELFGGTQVDTVHFLLPPGAEGVVIPDEYRPSCDRAGFRLTLFVLLPNGSQFVDTGGRQGICDGG